MNTEKHYIIDKPSEGANYTIMLVPTALENEFQKEYEGKVLACGDTFQDALIAFDRYQRGMPSQ